MIQKIKCFLGFHEVHYKTWETELGKGIPKPSPDYPTITMTHFQSVCIHCGKIDWYDYMINKPVDVCFPKTLKNDTF